MKRSLATAFLGVLVTAASSAGAFTWPNVPDEVARALSTDDVSERRAAAARLRELPAGFAAPLVMKALGDGDLEVRLIAARAAVEQRLQGAGDRVVGWLAESDPRVRLMACEVIRMSPAPAAVAPLTRALGDASADVRLAAATTLGVMSARDGVPSLLGHLDDPSPEVRAGIVLALGRIGDGRAVVPLLGKVQDGSSDVRRITVRVLGDLGDVKASSALLLALRDKVQMVQLEAIDSLGRLRSAEATAALSPLALDRSNPRVRNATVQALGSIGTPAALEALMTCLAGDDVNAERSAVREALVRLGDQAASRLVTAITSGASSDLASGACLVLGDLGNTAHTKVIVDAIQRGQVPARVGLRALARLGDRSALAAVLELLEAPSMSVRRIAVQSASELLDPSQPEGTAVDPIAAQLTEPRVAVEDRVALTELMGRTGSSRAGPVLIALAGAKDRRVRLAAIQALGMIGQAGQEKSLLEDLTDEDAEIRLAAALSLGRVSGDAGGRELLRRFGVASEQDRAAIGIALSGAMSRATDEAIATGAAGMLPTVREPMRDVVIEGLGRMKTPGAGQALAAVLDRALSTDDRRKVAEVASGHPEQVGLARKLASDPDPSVQANAIWSLGTIGDAADVPSLVKLMSHRDVAVAGNAVASIGRIASRDKRADAQQLCPALDDARSYVRANALAALGVAGARCSNGDKERSLLLADASTVVRSAAAGLLRKVSSSDGAADSRALRRCLYDDKSGAVAAECRPRPAARATRGQAAEPVLVFVVPDGRSAAQPRAPFALVLSNALMRLGIADRRGAVFEGAAPRGEVTLAVPATLSK
ncbi:MAG: HEAT repeat domain-containing protein [Deltaproteobacteria bacterium]|nr:HEAT repeat domain-containing protein [Deltaproteobacteria bacterium]